MNRWSKLFLGLCYTSNGPSTVLPREGGEYETKKMEEHETETVCKRKNEEIERWRSNVELATFGYKTGTKYSESTYALSGGVCVCGGGGGGLGVCSGPN